MLLLMSDGEIQTFLLLYWNYNSTITVVIPCLVLCHRRTVRHIHKNTRNRFLVIVVVLCLCKQHLLEAGLIWKFLLLFK